MFGNTTAKSGGLMGSKLNSTTLNCLKDMEIENQKLNFQLKSMKAAYKKLRDQYQGLYSQSSTYYQEAIENKEYKEQYDHLRKKCQDKETNLKESLESKNQPMLEQGNAYRRQFPYLSYANELPPNTEIHIKPVASRSSNSRSEPPRKKRREQRERSRSSKKVIAYKYKKYCDLYKNRNSENEEKDSAESDGESAMEVNNKGEH